MSDGFPPARSACSWALAGILCGGVASAAAEEEEPGGLRVEVGLMAYPASADSARVEIAAWAWADSLDLGPPFLFDLRFHVDDEVSRAGESPAATLGDETTPFRTWKRQALPGAARARVRADAPALGRTAVGSAFLEIPVFSEEPIPISTPFLGVIPAEPGESLPPVPAWGGLRPIPDRRFNEAGDTVAVYVAFGAPGANPGSDSIRVEGILRRGSTVLARDRWTLPGTVEGWIGCKPVSGLPGGDHRWTLRFDTGAGIVEREVSFRITAGGIDFLADPLRARETLAYVATGEERLALESSDEESLAALWERFWSRRDPTAGTPRNEARDLFVQRVGEAERRFGGVVPGWRTDQGRIFIRHGEPDRVERVPPRGSRRATEIWTYESGPRSYTFEDTEGYGVFRLVGGLRD